MRTQNNHLLQQQLQLQLGLATLKCLIILTPLLLQGQLARAQTPLSCSAESGATCSKLNGTLLFPFVSSPACASAASSSFVISGCSASSNSDGLSWPHFMNATSHPPFVIDFPKLTNASKENLITVAASGSMNLTWDSTLINESACKSLVSSNQIHHYLPQPINLTSFAHSAFRLTPSNIILLFNCTSPASPLPLKPDSSACVSYTKECGLVSSNCFQLTPVSQELNLPQLMDSSNCENAMFSVAWPSTRVPQWRPGLIQLSWNATLNPWMSSNLKSCEGCLQTNGSCGYNGDDNFQCYCPDNTTSETNCTAGVMEPPTDETPVAAPDQYDNGCDNAFCHPGNIVIGVVGGVLVITLFSFGALYYQRKKIEGLFTNRSTRDDFFESNGLAIGYLNLDGLMERPIEFRYVSIVFATNSFSNLLGEGGFGAVYRGTLQDPQNSVHMQIAVKVLEVTSRHSKSQFLNEVATIGRIHHVYVVRLLGFCVEESHKMLVYEYVVNGSLDTWLFRDSCSSKKPVLLWKERYAIAVGIAKGLSYLHEECRHRIVHCDIKPQNILLDEHMRPKVADFGLSKLIGREESRVVTLARGTPGYMAPEFWRGGESQLSTKFDVYSYGMVLLELISGQRNFGDDKCFPETAFEAAMEGDLGSILDVRMGSTACKVVEDEEEKEGIWVEGQQQVRAAVLVALWCIQDHPENRPSMREVVRYLEGIAVINEHPPRPTISFSIPVSAQQHAYFSDDLHYINDPITPISWAR